MRKTVLSALVVAFALHAQYDASVSVEANYNGWGWNDVQVMTNGLVTLATVPAIGGRIMEYSLGAHQLMWVSDELKGQVYDAAQEYTWETYKPFGGMINWPAPQDAWGWPPPVKIDQGPYTAQVVASSAAEVRLLTSSEVETIDSAAGLQMRREVSIYRGSSRVRVEQRLIETVASAQKWGIRDITRMPGVHAGEADYANFGAFFPMGSGTADGDSGWFALNSGTEGGRSQFDNTSIPGIVAFTFQQKEYQIGAHTNPAWVASVDRRDGYVYVKRSAYVAGGEYADDGAVVILWCSGAENQDTVIEVEMQGPLTDIAVGDSIVWVTDWYAARTHGPVVAVNDAGVVHENLAVTANTVSGKYGVFHAGRIDLVFNTSADVVATWAVTPLDSVVISQAIAAPRGATSASLLLYDAAGALVGTLDSAEFTSLQVAHAQRRGARAAGIVFRTGALHIAAPWPGGFELLVTGVDGRLIRRYGGSGTTVLPMDLKAGAYLYSLRGGGEHLNGRVVVGR